jgi:hypothetical protein
LYSFSPGQLFAQAKNGESERATGNSDSRSLTKNPSTDAKTGKDATKSDASKDREADKNSADGSSKSADGSDGDSIHQGEDSSSNGKSAESGESRAQSTNSDAVVESGAGLFEASQSQTETSSNGRGSSEEKESAFEIGGYVRGDVFIGKVPDKQLGTMKAGYGELALKFRARKEKFGDGYAEVRLREGLQGSTRDLIVDVREAYVNTYIGPFDLRLGKQIIVWGRADGLNPTNNLTPSDLRVRSPIEDDRRVGNVGARAFLNVEPFRVEGVWMPLYSPTMLPNFALPVGIVMGDTKYPAPELQNGLGAGRIHLELSSFDMSVSFLHGYAPLPGLSLNRYTLGPGAEVQIGRTAYDHNVIGFDFSTAIGEILGVRGEVAYRQPVDYQTRIYVPRPDLQYVLGVDHTFGSVSVIAQYVGRYAFDWHKENGPTSNLGVSYLANFDPTKALTDDSKILIESSINAQLAQKNQILFSQTAQIQHLASLRLEWLTLDETLSLSALGLVNVTTQEWVAFPKLAYQLSDRMSTAIGGEIYWGPKDTTLFGLIREELSAGYVEMRVSF